jgi:hypothetical protein
MKKPTIVLEPSYKEMELQAQYLAVSEEVARLTEIKDNLKTQIVNTFFDRISKDMGRTYNLGKLTASYRQEYKVDQLKTFEAFSKPDLRKALFPSSIQFKLETDKDLAFEHGLYVVSYNPTPVLTVNKK